jgi:hypothetical protein
MRLKALRTCASALYPEIGQALSASVTRTDSAPWSWLQALPLCMAATGVLCLPTLQLSCWEALLLLSSAGHFMEQDYSWAGKGRP